MKLIFDIEANDLLHNATKVWCLVIRTLDGKVQTFGPEDIHAGLIVLQNAKQLIGHNVIDYDFRVLKKLYGFEYDGEVFDTLVASRTIWPNLAELDFDISRKSKDFPAKLIGSHSLKAWGLRIGEYKGEWTDFSAYSPEMLEYCVQDTNVNLKLYERILNKEFSAEALDLEHRLHSFLVEQTAYGFPFDEQKAVELFKDLAEKKAELQEKLVNTFEPTIVQLKTKQKVIPFNPASRQQIGDRLMKRGWKPKVFTERGEPKVDEAVLSKIDMPEAKLLSEYLLLNKRLGQLATGKQAWLKLIQDDGKLHGSVNHMGAVTSRCTHNNPNMAQVPASSAPFGNECRSLFKANTKNTRGYKLLGCDASGLELRCLAHYMALYDGGTYADTVVNGDIHTVNQKAAGLETRSQAKVFCYGFLYGAGDAKIGEIIGKGAKEGKALKKRFLDNLPALNKLRKAVTEKAASVKKLKGLDGRLIPIRHQHAALNTLLQSAGAIICKTWYVYIAQELILRGFDAHIVGFIHDELQIVVKEDQAEMVGQLTKDMMKAVQKHFNFRCQLDCEYKIGDNWAETH